MELEGLEEGRLAAQQMVVFAAKAIHQLGVVQATKNDRVAEALHLHMAEVALEMQQQLTDELDALDDPAATLRYIPGDRTNFPENQPGKPTFRSRLLGMIFEQSDAIAEATSA